jgi:hypothetical protein
MCRESGIGVSPREDGAMSSVPAVLGATSCTVEVQDARRWLQRRAPSPRTVTTTDWTVDGVPLKDVMSVEPGELSDYERTSGLGNIDTTGELALLALLGEPVPPGMLMRTGEAVVLSTCGAECCPAVSARIEVGDDTVTWHDTAYRDWWGGETLDPVRTFIFDRASYERTIRGLIAEIRAEPPRA